MNAVEKIRAAILLLEVLRTASTQGKWAVSAKQLDLTGFVYAPSVCAGCGWDRDTDTDAELIVTLHRTIDVQLAILRDFDDRYIGRVDSGWVPVAPYARNAIALADAILA